MDDWKDLMDQIRSTSEDIEVPEELQPEAIEAMLLKHAAEEKKTENKFNKKKYRTWGSLAAAAMVAILVLPRMGEIQKVADMEAAAVVEEAEEAAPMESVPESEMGISEEPIAAAGSYEEIYEKLEAYEVYMYDGFREMAAGTGEMLEGSAPEEAPMAGDFMEPVTNAPAMDKAEAEEYSTTNTREEAVGEADIVKTDGEYIYSCTPSSAEVRIVRAKDLALCNTVQLEELAYVSEFFVENERLTILGGRSSTGLAEDKEGFYYSEYKSEAVVSVYDISDPENPKEMGTLGQEGSYYSSRKVGDYLYLFTTCHKEKKRVSNIDSYVPQVGESLLESDDIYLPSDHVTGRYLVVSSVNLKEPERFVDSKGILCDSNTLYISHQNIYLMQERYDSVINQTEIFKFWFHNGMIFSRAAGLVEGRIQDSFCIDEHNGDLRVVTTAWTGEGQKSSLYVMDSELQIIGRLEDVAPGEDVRSARLMGDIGYFVTFRQVDPLFCVDLSDPSDPKILGELKVSGFSSYLHPYGEGLMLGMGEEADESTGSFEGYKISMFDVSEPGQMKELDKVVFRDAYMAGLDNYKSVLADSSKNIIGICLEEWSKGDQSVHYQVYRYEDGKGFVKVLDYELTQEMNPEDSRMMYSPGYIRALYIGDSLYVVCPKAIIAFDMENDFEVIGKLLF